MSTVTALPPSLRDALHGLACRIRWLRALRGVSLLVLVLLASGALALGLDAWLTLPGIVRGLLLVGWLGLGAGFAWVRLLAPLLRSLQPEALAALVEERYPDLGERLTSAVELAQASDAWHGSPQLIAMLMEETETRTRRLDVTGSFSPRLALMLSAFAGAGLLVAACPAILWPQRYIELGRRFLTPWQSPEPVIAFALEVKPGDVFAGKDRPLIFTVLIRPLDSASPGYPKSLTLVCTDDSGQIRRVPLRSDRPEAFSGQIDRVPGDFDYHVEGGAVRSARHRVTAIEPANLVDDSPKVTVMAPAYAREVYPPETTNGLTDLTILENSEVRFEFQFTRPVTAASLEWTASSNTAKTEHPRVHPLLLNPEGRAGHLELRITSSGSVRLVLEVEHGIRTEIGPRLLTAQPDQSPVFVKVTGLPAPDAGGAAHPREDLRVVLPYETVPIEAVLADDIGLSQLHLEYRVNEAAPVREPLALSEANARQTTARHSFKLAQRALKEGDILRYRLRLEDNRHVPEAMVGPNVTYHPADRWLSLKIANHAQPLRQQEVAAQRAEIDKRLDAIKKDLEKEQRGIYKLREESREQSSLRPEQQQDLKQLRRENRSTETALRELAREAAATPALQPIADRAQDVADQEMQRGDQSLQAAQKSTEPQPRDERLRRADDELAGALRRLEELRHANERLAKDRLDKMKLEMLADRQQHLAERAAEQAMPDQSKESKPPELEAVKRDQGELANELEKLSEQSPRLRDSLAAARAEEAKKLAERTRELAKAQRDLRAATQDSEKTENETKLAELTRQQQALAEQAAKLAETTRQPTRAARTAPLKADEAKRAADALQQADAGIAQRHQQQMVQDLERLARDLEQAKSRAADTREAARQLARVQESLRQDLQERLKKQNPKVALASHLKAEQERQEALRQAAQELAVPPQRQAAAEEQKRAVEGAKQAAKALYKPNPPEADSRMRETQTALERLAERLPSWEDRQRQAREEVAQLRRQQEEIRKQSEQVLKAGKDKPDERNKRLAEAARRQAESSERLKKLDVPGKNTLAEQTRESLERAHQALRDAEPEEVRASQEEARQDLAELEKTLANRDKGAGPQAPGMPSREQAEAARQLAKEQRRVQDETKQLTQRSGAPANPLAELVDRQKAIADKAEALGTQTRREHGREAPVTQRSEEAAKTASETSNRLQAGALPQALKSGEQAAQQLRQLAQQLSQTPRGQTGADKPDPLQTSRALAEDQQQINERLGALAADAAVQRAQQAGRQEQLEKEADQLRGEMQQLARQMGRSPQAQQATEKASASGQQAQQSMRQAREQQQQSNRGQAQRNQQSAADALDRAAEQLDQAAGRMTESQSTPDPGPGQSLQQAQGQMRQAQSRMEQKQSQAAQKAMQQAADALQQAAQQLTQSPKSNEPNRQPNELGAPGDGRPDLSRFGEEAKKYAGKRWGELPGELRTKIVQELKARYGDDYARIIKLYFEQIADTQKK